jgi:adenylate cyclase
MQPILRRLQPGSGVVLLLYISLHLFNHALAIWSLDLAERGLRLAMQLRHSAPGTILLYGSAFVAGQLRNWLKRHGMRGRSLDA